MSPVRMILTNSFDSVTAFMVTLLSGVEVVGHGVACQVLGPLAGIPEGECTVEDRFEYDVEFWLDVVHCPCLLLRI